MCLCGCEKKSNFPINHLTGRAQLERQAHIDRMVNRAVTVAVIIVVAVGSIYFAITKYWPGG